MEQILLVVAKQVSSRHDLPTTTSVVLKDPPDIVLITLSIKTNWFDMLVSITVSHIDKRSK